MTYSKVNEFLGTRRRMNFVERSDTKIGIRARAKAARPREIIDAAFEEFSRKGYHATRIDDVAKRLGMTKGTIYFYFENKEILFSSMVEEYGREVFTDIASFHATLSGSASDKIRLLLDYLHDHINANPRGREMIRFLIAEGHAFPEVVARHIREFVEPLQTLCGLLLKEGAASGEFKPIAGTMSPMLVFSPLLAAVTMSLLKRGPVDEFGEEGLMQYMSVLLDGIAVR